MVGTLEMTQTKFTRGERVFVELGESSDVISPVTKEPMRTAFGFVRYVGAIVGNGLPFVSVRIELDNGTRGPVRNVAASCIEIVEVEDVEEDDEEIEVDEDDDEIEF